MKMLLFLFSIFIGAAALANNPGVSYQGRIFKPDGTALEGTAVQFRMQVRSPGSENCLLYEEVQTLNMAGSAGVFSLTINDGTGTRLDSPTYQVDRIFANRGTMTLDTSRCATGTDYTPNSSDGRKLVVYFKDETMAAYEAMPIMNLNYVPQSMYALESQKVGTFAVTNILRAVDGSGNPASAPALDPTQLTNLTNLLAGTSTQYATAAQFSTIQTFATTAPPTCGPSEVLKSNGTVLSCVTDSAGGAPAYSAITAASAANTIDNTNFAQTWNWSTATTQSPMSMSANALTTGSAMNVTTSSASLNSTNGLLNVANTGASTNGILARFQSNSTAGSGLTVLTNGNVGIGTTAPGAPLEVVSTTTTARINVKSTVDDSFILLAPGPGNSTKQWSLTAKSSNGVFRVSDDWNGLIPFTIEPNSASDALYIKAGGNVGIGTNSPTALLDVQGGNSTTGNGIGINLSARSALQSGTPSYNGGDVVLTAGRAYNYGSPGNIVLNPATTGGGSATVPGSIFLNGRTNIGWTAGIPNAGIIQHSPSNYQPSLSVGFYSGDTPAGIATISANTNSKLNFGVVGLGARSWASSGTALQDGDLMPGFMWGGLTSPGLGTNNVVSAGIYGQVDGTVSALNLPTSIVFQTSLTNSAGLTEKMRITSSGNVGIGTTNPTNRLEISQNQNAGTAMKISNSTVGVLASAGIAVSSDSVDLSLGAFSSSYLSPYTDSGVLSSSKGLMVNTANGDIKFTYASLNERMRIVGSSGNVGIGTTTPQDKLSVNGNIQVAKNSSQPYACDAAHDAVIALTSQYTTCVCKGGSATWVRTTDGSTACTW